MEPFDPNSFMNQLKLKEAFYLMEQGKNADQSTINQILAQILPKVDQTNTLLLRFKKAMLEVFSQENSSLEILPTLGLAVRGKAAESYKLERALDNHAVFFIFSPNTERTEIHLAVEVEPPAPYRVKLKLDGDTIETLGDLRKEKMFDSPISM
jgi:hypothetical protein